MFLTEVVNQEFCLSFVMSATSSAKGHNWNLHGNTPSFFTTVMALVLSTLFVQMFFQ
jgi:hypothetical protein